MKKEQKIYLVFNGDEEGSEYWEQFESLADAVGSHGDGVEVYVAKPKRLGEFKCVAKLLKIKARKRKEHQVAKKTTAPKTKAKTKKSAKK